jgi:hypothetical protein
LDDTTWNFATAAASNVYSLLISEKAEGPTLTTTAVDTTGCTLLVAVANFYSTGTAPMIEDSKGNTWTAGTQQIASSASVQLYYCIAPTVGSGHTFTVKGGNGGSSFMAMSVLGFSRTSPLFDAAAAGSAGNINPTRQPGSITPAGDDGLFVTAIGIDTPATHNAAMTIDGGFTISERVASSAPVGHCVAYKIKTDGTAENPTWTENAASFPAGGCVMMAFK